MGEDFSTSNKVVLKSKLIFFFFNFPLVFLFLPGVSMIEFLSYPKIIVVGNEEDG
jgi:hypothetical protein